MARLATLPLIVLLMGLAAILMLVPAIYGWASRDLETARAFLYPAILFLILFVMIGQS